MLALIRDKPDARTLAPMHQRTWLSLITLPFVATLSHSVLLRQGTPAPRVEAKAGQDPLAGISDIQDVLGLVRDNYVDAPNLEKVVQGGIQGALERAHPLNAYLSPEDLRLPEPGPAQVGLRLIKRGIYAQVVVVRPGSPADKAGVQLGDIIRKVDGVSVGSLSAWQLERSLRGAEGSELSLLRYANANGELKKLVLKREKAKRLELGMRKEARGTLITLPDLEAGRAHELKSLLEGLDPAGFLLLDLRACAGGSLAEAAAAAGCLVGDGPLVTVQEARKPDQTLRVLPQLPKKFTKVAVLIGPGTLGVGEVLASALKQQGLPLLGERSAALGVERSRFPLKQGGAVELVNKRWIGAGGEKLAYAERPSATREAKDKEELPGVLPQHPLKGLKPEDDVMGKAIEALEKAAKPAKSARLGSAYPGLGRRDPLGLGQELG